MFPREADNAAGAGWIPVDGEQPSLILQGNRVPALGVAQKLPNTTFLGAPDWNEERRMRSLHAGQVCCPLKEMTHIPALLTSLHPRGGCRCAVAMSGLSLDASPLVTSSSLFSCENSTELRTEKVTEILAPLTPTAKLPGPSTGLGSHCR